MILFVTSPARLRLFESSQPLLNHQTLNEWKFHRFLFSLARRSRKCRVLYAIPQTKQCELNSIPTWLVKELCDVLAPVMTAMDNASFTQSRFPDTHKHAIVRPRFKKPSLDPTDVTSYHPISNLSFVSKTVKRLVVNRLAAHANQHSLLPVRQSTHRQHHLIETAVIIIHNDIVRSTDAGLM